MLYAYSRLKRVLSEQNMSVPELHRRMVQQGMRINAKSLYRLSNEHQPLQRLDLRVAGAICTIFEMPLSQLITFETPGTPLRRLAAHKQKRLDALLNRNSAGKLTPTQKQELQELVRQAEEIMVANARQLAEERKHLERG
jgi:hypothetical protein